MDKSQLKHTLEAITSQFSEKFVDRARGKNRKYATSAHSFAHDKINASPAFKSKLSHGVLKNRTTVPFIEMYR